jgi:hypothetical protein
VMLSCCPSPQWNITRPQDNIRRHAARVLNRKPASSGPKRRSGRSSDRGPPTRRNIRGPPRPRNDTEWESARPPGALLRTTCGPPCHPAEPREHQQHHLLWS